MTDKEKIKQEIERRIENLKISLDKNCVTEESKLDIRGNITTLYGLLKFIDSLPEEPANEDLEEEVKKIDDQYPVKIQYIREIASHFVKWQKQKDQSTIELAEEHAMLAGMNKIEEEITKDAVDCDVFKKEDNMADLRWKDNTAFERLVSKFNDGDKVKLIIIKKG